MTHQHSETPTTVEQARAWANSLTAQAERLARPGFSHEWCDDLRDVSDALRSLALQVETLGKELAGVTNHRNTLQAHWDQSCEHVAEACQMLGLDAKEVPCDTWALCEQADKVVAERAALRAALQRAIDLITPQAHAHAVDTDPAYEGCTGTPRYSAGLRKLHAECAALLPVLRAAMGEKP